MNRLVWFLVLSSIMAGGSVALADDGRLGAEGDSCTRAADCVAPLRCLKAVCSAPSEASVASPVAPAPTANEPFYAGTSASFGVGYGAVTADGQPSGLTYSFYGSVAFSQHFGIPVLLAIGYGESTLQSNNPLSLRAGDKYPAIFGAYMTGLRVRYAASGPYMDGLLGWARSTTAGLDMGPLFGVGGSFGWNIPIVKVSDNLGDFGITPNLSLVYPPAADQPVFMAMIGISVIVPDRHDWKQNGPREAPSPDAQTANSTATDAFFEKYLGGTNASAAPVDTDWAHVSERPLMKEFIGKRVRLNVAATGAENQPAQKYWQALSDRVFPLVGAAKLDNSIWRSAPGGGTSTAVAALKPQADVFLGGSPEKVVEVVGRLNCSTRGWNESGGCLVLVDSAKVVGQLNQLPPFDRGAAAQALSEVVVADCKTSDGSSGAGHVKITFSPDGSAGSVAIDGEALRGTPLGECIVGHFLRARVPAFTGGPVTVGKSFSMD